jgi:replicative DNA helicase
VTDDYIVTHNSGLGFQIGVQTAEWVRGQWDQGLSVEAGGVAFVSLEMSKESLATRQLAAVSGLDSRRIARGSLTSFEYEQLESAKKRLTNLPIQVIDACGLTPTMIRMRLRQAQRRMMAKHKTKIGLVVIDHLQLVEAGAELSAQGGAWASAQVAKDILKIAKGFHSHVLALSQITSPAEEHREIDWRPTGKNLSWSKGFREAADNILILYRVEAHLPKTEPMMRTDESAEHLNERIEEWRKNHKDFHRKAELILEKVRDGRAGMVINLVFEATTTSFTEAIEAAPRWGA